jgi:hypothetical protein
MFQVWLIIFASTLLVVLPILMNMPEKGYEGRFRPFQLMAFSIGIFIWTLAFTSVVPRGQWAWLGVLVLVLILLLQLFLSVRFLFEMKGHRLYVLAISLVAAVASLWVSFFSLMGITDDWL